jgi:hypothetical protein
VRIRGYFAKPNGFREQKRLGNTAVGIAGLENSGSFKDFGRIPSGPGSSVGVATDYGLDGPGIESRWGRDFLHLSRTALGPTQPPVQ